MLIRTGLISNSSSTSFIITNKSPADKQLKEFVIENKHLITEFNNRYGYKYTEDEVVISCESYNMMLKPGQNEVVFGDEEGTVIGQIYDYILRDGGESRSFKWEFLEYNR